MRARDFIIEFKASLPQATSSSEEAISTLSAIGQSAEENPEVLALAHDAVAKAKQLAQQILAKVQSDSKKPPAPALAPPAPVDGVTEAAATLTVDQQLFSLKEEIASVEKDIEAICQAMGDKCDTVIANLRKFLESAYAKITALVSQGQQQGREEEFAAGQKFLKEFDSVISAVTAKVTGTLSAFQANQVKQNAVDQTVEVKQALDETQIQKAVRGTITAIFSDLAHKAVSREELVKQRKLLGEFLTKCIKGIVPLTKLIDAGSGNILNQLQGSKFKAIYDRVIKDLLGAQPAGSGAGAWGPAELGLSVIGSPVNKDGKGDLNIGGNRRIELKASKNATSGGRINTPVVNKGIGGKGDYDIAWREYAPLLGIKQSGSQVQFQVNLKSGKVAEKSIKYTTWGPTLIDHVLNPAIRKRGIDRATTIQFLTDVAVAPVLADFKKEARKRLKMARAVAKDGSIIGKEFLSQYIALLMSFYAEGEEKVEEILVINPVTGNFQVINAGDPKGIQEKIDSGAIQTSTTWIDFTDKQSTASPQIGTA
jgi:hypothetical protein